jgi:hypothetical protein
MLVADLLVFHALWKRIRPQGLETEAMSRSLDPAASEYDRDELIGLSYAEWQEGYSGEVE